MVANLRGEGTKKENFVVQSSFVTNETGGKNDDAVGSYYRTRER